MTAVVAPPYWRGLADVPWSWGRSVVTLGVFDGLHRGHARLLARAVELGARRGLPVVLVTFDPHPATVAGGELRVAGARGEVAVRFLDARRSSTPVGGESSCP